ncbi:MAG: (Fe-S)-binding protein [Candidatus Hydrothermarchaeales archaeon]
MTALAEDIERQVEAEIASCTECKKCLLVCPLPEAKGLDIFTLNREILSENPSKNILDFAFLCFSCGACNYSCPQHLRRDIHMVYLRSKGHLPKGYNNLLHWRGQRLGLAERTLYRLKKIKDAPQPEIAIHLDKTEFRKTDLLFYFACYAYSPSAIPQKTLAIADHLGVDYDVIAGYSHCCGWPHFLAGEFRKAEELLVDLFNTIAGTKAKKVVTGCAECYQALKFIKERYAGDFEVLTTPEWLIENLDRLDLEKTGETATFHDACQLSRLDDKEEVPRRIIPQIFDLMEMEENRKNTICCGGMRAAHETNGLIELRKKRLSDAKKTGAKIMLTECVTCFEKYKPLEEDIQIKDLTEVVHDNIVDKNVG